MSKRVVTVSALAGAALLAGAGAYAFAGDPFFVPNQRAHVKIRRILA
ncbi:hypothetical protein I3W98_16090, partial [Streptomyces cavourensis]|nr:hypothetical protein [Streptomyces cavourensis]